MQTDGDLHTQVFIYFFKCSDILNMFHFSDFTNVLESALNEKELVTFEEVLLQIRIIKTCKVYQKMNWVKIRLHDHHKENE